MDALVLINCPLGGEASFSTFCVPLNDQFVVWGTFLFILWTSSGVNKWKKPPHGELNFCGLELQVTRTCKKRDKIFSWNSKPKDSSYMLVPYTFLRALRLIISEISGFDFGLLGEKRQRLPLGYTSVSLRSVNVSYYALKLCSTPLYSLVLFSIT